jgi:hypothetical protein
MDWKLILGKAIDIGGPIAAKVIDVPAPGLGTAIGAGLPMVKEYVVDRYVPGEEPSTEQTTEAQTATAFLLKQGWSQEDIRHQMKGPRSPNTDAPKTRDEPTQQPASARVPATDAAQAAAIVHAVLDEAGWSAAQKQALLKGPDALKAHWLAGREEPREAKVTAPKSGHVEDIIIFDKRT